jgi:hypothetical protein
MGSSDILGVFVIHYSKLLDRKVFLETALKRQNREATWVTEKAFHDFESKDHSPKKILGISERLVGMDLGINSRSLTTSRRRSRLEGKVLFLRSYLSKNNTFSTGSLPIKNRMPESFIELQKMHVTALKSGLEQRKNWILVLEDDALPKEGAFRKIAEIMGTVEPKNLWINLNSGAGMIRTKSENRIDKNGLFEVKPAATRCAVAYLISNDLATKFVNSAVEEGIPHWLPIDFYYQVLLRKFKGKSFWIDPVLFDQGSESGEFRSGFEKFR